MRTPCDVTISVQFIVRLLNEVRSSTTIRAEDCRDILNLTAESKRQARQLLARRIAATASASAANLDRDRQGAKGKPYARLTWLRATLPLRRLCAIALLRVGLIPSGQLVAAIRYPPLGDGDEDGAE
jgi:hypothetical protein